MVSLRGSAQFVILLGGILLAVAVTAPAVAYLVISYSRMAGLIEAEAAIHASQINRIISMNPSMWELEGQRIRGLLTHYYASSLEHESLVVVNEKGETVVFVGAEPRIPVMVRRHDLMDFGEVTGSIEIRRSLRGVLATGLVVLLASWGAGIVLFVFLRRIVFEVFLKAEKSLRESERKYRRIFAIESFAIMLFDAETRKFIDVNGAALALYGYSRREFLELHLGDITAEPEKTEVSVRLTIEKGTTRIPLRYHRRKDGVVFPVEISVGSFDLRGRKVIFGVIRDISPRLEYEGKLLHHQKQLRDLASALSSAEETERRELAAILHDDIGQLLAICKMKLEEREPPGGSPPLVRDIGGARELLEQAIARTRSLTWELSSQTLFELGLAPALEELCANFGERHGLRCRVVCEREATALPRSHLGILYRAVRELLVNVVRHSGGTAAEVAVARTGDRVEISVCDDGKGFSLTEIDAFPEPTGRFGLFNIRERLQTLGGETILGSSPMKGAKVILSVPAGDPTDEREGERKDDADQGAAD